MFKHQKIIEYLSKILNEVRDILKIRCMVEKIDHNLYDIESSIQYTQEGIREIKNHLFQKDTEIIIFNGKKYRITESQLTTESGGYSTLDLCCVECSKQMNKNSDDNNEFKNNK